MRTAHRRRKRSRQRAWRARFLHRMRDFYYWEPSVSERSPEQPDRTDPDAPRHEPPPEPWHDPGPPVRKVNLPPDSPSPGIEIPNPDLPSPER